MTDSSSVSGRLKKLRSLVANDSELRAKLRPSDSNVARVEMLKTFSDFDDWSDKGSYPFDQFADFSDFGDVGSTPK